MGSGASEHRRRAARGTRPPASYRRSYRCRTALDRAPERAVRRYDDFVALHERWAAEPEIDVRRVWWCGVALAFAAAALAASAAFLGRALFGVPVPAFLDAEAGPGSAGLTYGVCAGAVTVQATALLHVLSGTAERPVRSFAWTGALVVVIAALLPLTVRGDIAAMVATAALNLAGGTLIVGMLTLVGAASREWPDARPRRRRRWRR
ncbi:DUF6069 family protein [Actinomadura rayongensis]|uniref:Uncharacterized protein n=1 Tax=Actinomadura rayongensis TaxID=1429076 RepID=A0A6I4WA60_9ACTN|nr:DUF6069 family protein [Actinomadura rayongensis]MXQ66461.1 hypothetical protein [Actinomadura rayongensis]